MRVPYKAYLIGEYLPLSKDFLPAIIATFGEGYAYQDFTFRPQSIDTQNERLPENASYLVRALSKIGHCPKVLRRTGGEPGLGSSSADFLAHLHGGFEFRSVQDLLNLYRSSSLPGSGYDFVAQAMALSLSSSQKSSPTLHFLNSEYVDQEAPLEFRVFRRVQSDKKVVTHQHLSDSKELVAKLLANTATVAELKDLVLKAWQDLKTSNFKGLNQVFRAYTEILAQHKLVAPDLLKMNLDDSHGILAWKGSGSLLSDLIVAFVDPTRAERAHQKLQEFGFKRVPTEEHNPGATSLVGGLKHSSAAASVSSPKWVSAFMPANIAWLKYMGKIQVGAESQASTPSVSSTFSKLGTFTMIYDKNDPSALGEFSIQSQRLQNVVSQLRLQDPNLTESENEKIRNHFRKILPIWEGIARDYRLSLRPNFSIHLLDWRTLNSFPVAAGIASSASSFASFTLAFCAFSVVDLNRFKNLFLKIEFRQKLADLSRLGSGSSCRSFFGPMTEWTSDGVSPWVEEEFASNVWDHRILVCSHDRKEVSSSEAHRRVVTSPLYQEWLSESQNRMNQFKQAYRVGDWKTMSHIAEKNYKDMHQLFRTSAQSFDYFNAKTRSLLQFLEAERSEWDLITMDAGPNIHLTCVDRDFSEDFLKRLACFEISILADRFSRGGTFWSS